MSMSMEETISYEPDFSVLPPHIITHIFKYLKVRQRHKAALTCQAWNYASLDPSLNRDVCLKVKGDIPKLHTINRPFGKLDMHCMDFNNFTFKKFFKKCGESVHDLSLSKSYLSYKQLVECLARLPNLRILHLTTYGINYNYLDDVAESSKTKMSTNLKGLVELSLELSRGYEGLQTIISEMISLERLHLQFCSNLWNSDVLKNMFNYLLPNRDEVKLEYFEMKQLLEYQSPHFFRDIGSVTRKLNIHTLVLAIIDADYYDEYFEKFCKKFSKLKVLKMWSMGERQLFDICQYMVNLTELHVWMLKTRQLRMIGKLRAHIETLNLNISYRCDAIKQTEIVEIFSTPFTKLLNLHLDYLVEDEVLVAICKNCPQLKALNLDNLNTTNLESIFINLINLVRLTLNIQKYEPNFNVWLNHDVTNLNNLEVLEINRFAAGMTMELIEKLPRIKLSSIVKIRKLIY